MRISEKRMGDEVSLYSCFNLALLWISTRNVITKSYSRLGGAVDDDLESSKTKPNAAR